MVTVKSKRLFADELRTRVIFIPNQEEWEHFSQKGDFVLTPLKISREVLIGEATGDYEFNLEAISEQYPNIRRVK